MKTRLLESQVERKYSGGQKLALWLVWSSVSACDSDNLVFIGFVNCRLIREIGRK